MRPIFDFSKTGFLARPTRTSKATVPFNIVELNNSSVLPTIVCGLPSNSITCALLHLDYFVEKHSVADLVGFLCYLRSPLGKGLLLTRGPTSLIPELTSVFYLLDFVELWRVGTKNPIVFYGNKEHAEALKKGLKSQKFLKKELSREEWSQVCKNLVAAVGDSKEPQPKFYEFFPTKSWEFSLAALSHTYQPTIMLLKPKQKFLAALNNALKGYSAYEFGSARPRNVRQVRKTLSRQSPTKRGHSNSKRTKAN